MKYKNLPYENMRRLSLDVFSGYGFSVDECEIITDVLLCSDLFGIESHGIQRMTRYHMEILDGMTDPKGKPKTVHETPVSAIWDGGKAMGQILGKKAMETAIAKAKASGIGMVTVRNANHYGIAGYYAHMAVGHDLMGMCMTNSEAIGVPVYGKQAMFGTNPIAYAFPADPIPFLYDAATTVVTRGKVEIYNKTEEPLPDNWAVGQDGKPSNNAGEIIGSIIAKAGGGISPLGGGSELYGGHKGYGLSVIVEIFTSILSQGTTSNYVSLTKDYSGIAHFYMAIDYGLFGDKALIKQNLSAYLRELRESGKAEGQERIYTHGEKEYESREKVLRDGIPANEKTIREIREIAGYHGLDFDSYFA